MLTYQVRPRIFRVDGGHPKFPADCVVRFHFLPKQPFGVAPGVGRTAVLLTPARARFDANTGAHTIESTPPLSPLEVVIEEPIRRIDLVGNTMSIRQQFASIREFQEFIESVFYVLPSLLNVVFIDPPFIEHVDGEIESVNFRWELSEWRARFTVTTQELQETNFVNAWNRFDILSAEP